MSHEWSKLRAWNGSKEKAFEELCCQLAAAEQMPDGCRFTRKGTPDAGVECFWTLPNGDEWAWQAKLFFQMQEVQWRQLDDSVKQALTKHPKMLRYYVCLPIDLADPRLISKKTNRRARSARDVWDLRVKKWEQWAVDLGVQVKFEYWGDHEIWLRLTKNEHRGRMLFWFNEQWFSDEWLSQRIEEACSNAGKRYLPELHVELELERAFEALGRTDQFFLRLADQVGSVRREFDQCGTNRLGDTSVEGGAGQLAKALYELMGMLPTTNASFRPLPLSEAAQSADRAGRLAFQLAADLRRVASAASGSGRSDDRYSYECHHLRSLQDRLADLREFLESPEAVVANTAALLLVGDAGTGKTHMFCEIARRRAAACQPTVLFLAEHFVLGEPWSQMLCILGLRCDRDEFFGALDAIAEARGTRALVFVDALNEEAGWEIWPKHLPAMLTQVRRHRMTGLAVSVRSSYETLVIPGELHTNGALTRFAHSGFQGREEESVDRYFAHYGIDLPSFPILDPEFSNPLFLRVLCESVQNSGLSRIPPGLRGFTAVFRFFLDSVSEKLARPNYLDYDAQRHVVMQAVAGFPPCQH